MSWEERAKDPTTELTTLFTLVDTFPEEVSGNPIVPLLFLENPVEAIRLILRARIAIGRRTYLPTIWLSEEGGEGEERFFYYVGGSGSGDGSGNGDGDSLGDGTGNTYFEDGKGGSSNEDAWLDTNWLGNGSGSELDLRSFRGFRLRIKVKI